MPHTRWYWGAVIRVDAAADLLRAVDDLAGCDDVRVQDSRTGHVTLFYAPLRSRNAAPDLGDRIRAAVARMPAFDLRLGGFGEFESPTRPVAWLGVRDGAEPIAALRDVLCGCDDDCHNHAFVPHLTLAYGQDPERYAAARDALRTAADAADVVQRVDAIWIAGFPQSGHPARDLRYAERLPLGDAGPQR